MKNQTHLSISLIFISLILFLSASCTKDEENELMPRITIYDDAGLVSSDTSMRAGEDINLKVRLQGGDHNITNFYIEVLSNGTEKIYFDTGMNITSFLWHGSFLKSSAPSERWRLIATDRNGNTVMGGFTILLDSSSAYKPLLSYPSILLGAQASQETGGCLNLSNQEAYFHFEVAEDVILQEGVDIVYYYFGEDKNIIASPGANIEDEVFTVNPADWTIVNTTRYIKTGLTADDFNMAQNDSIIIVNYDQAEAKRKAKKLQTGQIYTFRTQTGKLGMFHVNEVTGAEQGSLNIAVKIQE